MATNITLDQRFDSSHGTAAFDVCGSGDPLVLIHGTPSFSYLWSIVIEELRGDWAVYVFDLIGFGQWEKFEGQDLTLKAQGKVFSELFDCWNLEPVRVVEQSKIGTDAGKISNAIKPQRGSISVARKSNP